MGSDASASGECCHISSPFRLVENFLHSDSAVPRPDSRDAVPTLSRKITDRLIHLTNINSANIFNLLQNNSIGDRRPPFLSLTLRPSSIKLTRTDPESSQV